MNPVRYLAATRNLGSQPASTGDQDFASVVLLAPFESDFVDIKGHTASSIATPTIGTPNAATFGANSLQLDGGDGVQYAASADWALGGTWTVEFWVRLQNTATGNREAVSHTSASGVYLGCNFEGAGYACPTIRVSGVSQLASATQITADTPCHVAFVSDPGHATKKVRIYQNGVETANKATAISSITATVALDIGGNAQQAQAIKDVRITKGVARYSANFTPPTTAAPTS